jgi:cobalt/nickel transport system permease protein
MHIPDGFLSNEVCIATSVVSLGAVAYSLHRMKDSLADRTVPLTGMMGSLIFAGQMVNFPIGLPVSGHLMGGVLAAAVLGPWAGCVAMTMVLVAQWALFSDGGLTALGANVLHMGVVGSMGGYAVLSGIRRLMGSGARGAVVGAVAAAWLSVMAASTLFCLELRCSYTSADFDFSRIFTLMVSFHSLIGIGEALITGVVLSVVCQQRPDLIDATMTATPSTSSQVGRFLAVGLICALGIGAFAAPFASQYSDGLEAVAEQTGIEASEQGVPGLFTDYDAVPLSQWQSLSVSIAGVGGSLAIFLMAILLGRSRRLVSSS